ncbi:MAG: hypothetical protein R8P61_20455 [Bacteroidia bacterium]|nr:hypothetical protein [Bacteroidia bacterium]
MKYRKRNGAPREPSRDGIGQEFRQIASSENREKEFLEFPFSSKRPKLNQALGGRSLGQSHKDELYLQIMRLKGGSECLPNKYEDAEVQLSLVARRICSAYSSILVGRYYEGLLEGIPVKAFLAQVSLNPDEIYLVISVLEARKKEEAVESYTLLVAKALEDCVKENQLSHLS